MVQNKTWASSPIVFNDPFEFKLKEPDDPVKVEGLKYLKDANPQLQNQDDKCIIALAKDSFEKKIRGFGVISLTEDPESILMWSHYADQHKGFCLGFQFSGAWLSERGVYPVDYSRQYPELNFAKIWYVDGLSKILLTKSEDWKYEKEWRIIKADGEGLNDYPGELVEVIFGLRTTEEDQEMIRRILNDKCRVKYFRITQHLQEYKLQREAI